MAKIKRNDMVVVIAGKNKGTKTHRVLRVYTDKQRVLVEGINIVTKHKKPTQTTQGGIVKQEAPIHISNVMVVDSEGKPTRIGFSTEGGKKTRIARSNGASIAEPKAK
jgi:large subunit ribosomal protein L24